MQPGIAILLSADSTIGETSIEMNATKKRSRKSSSNAEKWEKNKAKLARQHGDAYMFMNSQGVHISGKAPPISSALCVAVSVG